jgi:hypothetical protein
VKFNATPSGNNINTVVGLTNGPQSVYTRLAAIVRFSLFCIEDSIEGNVWQLLPQSRKDLYGRLQRRSSGSVHS